MLRAEDAQPASLEGEVDKGQEIIDALNIVTDRMVDIPALAELRKAVAERIGRDQLSGVVRADVDPAALANGTVTIILSLLMSVVQFGDRVTFEREDGRMQTFRIVGEDQADPAKGSISFLSPVGQALLGREVGDEVTVDIPRGRVTYEVIGISFKGSNLLN